MRISYIHGNYIDSEEANVVQAVDMSQAFAQCDADVTLIMGAPRKKSAEPMSLLEEYLGQPPAFRTLTYKKFTVAGRLGVLGNYIGVRALLRSLETDVCFVDDPLILRLCLGAGFLTVFESHESEMPNWLSKFWEIDVLASARNPKLVKFVTISKALADIWRTRGVPDEKIMTAHDGVSQRTLEGLKSQAEARRMVGLPVERKVVVYAGSLYPNREVERIVRLSREYPAVLFVVLGGPATRVKYLAELSKREDADNIRWLGHIPHANVATYLQAADVLLMLWTWSVPTIKICSPLKMFEYMAAQRIIVGEAFPTITEVLADGENAYLAKPGIFEDLCTKLREALSQSYPSQMAAKARKLAVAEYSWNARAAKILQSVDGLV